MLQCYAKWQNIKQSAVHTSYVQVKHALYCVHDLLDSHALISNDGKDKNNDENNDV